MSEAPVAEPSTPPGASPRRRDPGEATELRREVVARPSAPYAVGARRDTALTRLKDSLRSFAHATLGPLVRWMVGVGIRADHLTLLGLGFSAGAGLAFFDGHSRLGALLLAFAGVCDILDGQVARESGGETKFGAFFDSTLDRLSEALVLIGMLGFCLRNLLALVTSDDRLIEQVSYGLYPYTWALVGITAMLALTGSFLVSYTRARAEGLGLDCKVGWFERPERIVLLIIAGLLKVFWAMSGALLLLATFSFITAAQRVAHVYRITRPRQG